MILKKEGVLDLDRLRTIVLYEADFNFFNKSVGRNVMDTAMVNGGMASEQYAKPRSSAQEQCLARRLVFDIVRHIRQALAMASSDLKSCYDRIVHNAASLALQKNGVSQETVSTMFATIQQCQHHIRTAYGDSSKSYGGQRGFKLPPMGAGQGNGAGPQMWAILSSVLFLAMHMEGLSTRFCQKMTKKFLSLTGFMYVDDMDLICIRDEHNKQNITEDLQLTISYWNRLVKVTGGALEPTKSGWYAFCQEWNSNTGQYEYKDIGPPKTIKAKDKDGAKHSLPFISCHSSQEMIGVKMTPTGDQTDQLKSMSNKSYEEARNLRKGNLSEVETRHAVVSSIFPWLAWSLPCMSITQQESKNLVRPVLTAALSKMGVVSTLGYDYIHGSSAFQGLGIPELFHAGYAAQIELLVDNIWKSTQTGHFIQMAIQEFVLETGSTQHPFLPTPNTRLDNWLLTKQTWFAALRSYMISHQIQVDVTIPLLTSHRQHDVTIMDILDESSQFSSLDLKDINTCRVYKRVTFLSDISSGDGTRLTTKAWTTIPNDRATQYPFNTQHFPTTRQWRAWKAAMTYINQANTNQLRQPLGKWQISSEDQYLQYWDYFYDPTFNVLLQQHSLHHWTLHSPMSQRTRQRSFTKQGYVISSPQSTSSLCRTTICKVNDALIMEGYSSRDNIIGSIHGNTLLLSCTEAILRKIQSHCQKFSDSSWAIKYCESSPSIDHLLQDFRKGKAIMVGDGSYNDDIGLGAGACIISSADGAQFIISGGPTPGPKSTQNPYRSELGTMVSMGILAHALTAITNSNPNIVVACDNDNALERPFLPPTRLSAKQASADLVTLAHDIWKSSTAKLLPTRVKGHADQLNRQLSLIELLNCRVDAKAKEYLSLRNNKAINRAGDPVFGLPHISFQGDDITGNVSHQIQSLQSLQRSKNAGIRNGQFTQETWAHLDLRARISRASSNMSTFKKIFRTKWISNQLPVGYTMKQRKHRLFDNCPMCLQQNETLAHLTTCPSREVISEYSLRLENLSSWLQQVNTDPIIHHHLIALLSILRTNNDIRPLPYPCILTKRTYYDTFKAQEAIGWKQFTQGLISDKWSTLQQSYYSSIQDSHRTGIAWASQLIIQLWDINLHIWLYRNNRLHENNTLLQQLHGQSYLDAAIEKEFCRGKGNLPTPFSPFFSKYTLSELLALNIESKINWFKTIRTAREDIGSNIQDEFSHNPALRTLVGLRRH
jgi:hypothetical protein